MADFIRVVELERPNGRPQPYEVAVIASTGRSMPDLPFLHGGDGITVEDGTAYIVESARQVAVRMTGGTQWSWVYRATRDTSNEPKGRPW
jgi:hypothetical protein